MELTETVLIARQFFFYLLGLSVYRIYFHPLKKFPGPRLWAASRLPWVLATISGRLHHTIKKLHIQYGDAVRVAPDEVIFASAQAWKDIYGHRSHGTKSFQKDMMLYNVPPNGTRNLLQTSDSDHSRIRRLLAHAFSDKALREQEPLIQSYVDLLIAKLRTQPGPVDMVAWYNWATFDIIGDLSFGSPFGCLEDSVYKPWVRMVFENVKASVFINVSKHFPVMKIFAKWFTPPTLMASRVNMLALGTEKVSARLGANADRPDFISFILRHNDEKGMSRSEIDSNAALLILAGSETTATLLSGCTYYLLKNPDVYRKLVEEVRGSFKNEEDITISEALTLPYLNAVLEESLRIYPPVPTSLSRRVPDGGATVNGQYVEAGVSPSTLLFLYIETFLLLCLGLLAARASGTALANG